MNKDADTSTDRNTPVPNQNSDSVFEWPVMPPHSSLYQEMPTIENYVKLRRSNPENVEAVKITSGLDWLFSNSQHLTDMGIEPGTFAKALDANKPAISEVSLRLLELLVERQKLKSDGVTHAVGRGEAVSDSLVNYIISIMLDALDWAGGMTLPRDLLVLIRYQISGDRSTHENTQNQKHARQQAISLAVQLREQGKSGSLRQVAKLMQVRPSTVSRWFEDQSFEDAVAFWTPLMTGPAADDLRALAKNVLSN
ncbi:MAG: hypothetical protein P8P99_03510 [Maricaulis sp.]|nr:hypothetical protein [Maricaulis sp.]